MKKTTTKTTKPKRRAPKLTGHTFQSKLLAADSLAEYARDMNHRAMRIGDTVWMCEHQTHAYVVAIVFRKVIGIAMQYREGHHQIGHVLMEDDSECSRECDAGAIHDRAYELYATRPTPSKTA